MTSIFGRRRAFRVFILAGVAIAIGLAGAPRARAVTPYTWQQRGPFVSASGRYWHAMAYDAARGKTVLFGGCGNAGCPLGDTWEFDGTTWVQRTPATSPPARQIHAMAYDAARGKVVLFGGYDGSIRNDTWEWDGTTWTQRTPVTSPPARNGHAMAFDAARGKVVLFGGCSSACPAADTWEWDGTTWTQRAPATSPPARYYHAMAYDAAHGKVVLFGGCTVGAGCPSADTWEWDGTTWTQRIPGASPAARYWHAMAYDAARGKTVLFGGCGNAGCPSADTWEWDGTTWAQRSPGTSPAIRNRHALAYDAARGKIVMFGGCAGSGCPAGDTWDWDGTRWIRRDFLLPARYGTSIAYDAARGKTVIFSGCGNAGCPSADTWEWDGTVWTQRTPATSPPGRFRHAMVYDAARGKVVLFGGQTSSGHLGDTWEWDGTTWTQRTPATSPPPRGLNGIVYDSARAKVVLFGGFGNTGILSDTWEWDGTTWTQRTPATSPPARYGNSMSYDDTRGRTVLFGGCSVAACPAADTWEWDGTTWTQRTPAASPPGRFFHATAYDATRGRVVLFGGRDGSGSGLYEDTWEWDGTTWTQGTPAASPSRRNEHAMVYDSARSKVVMLGGHNFAIVLGDTSILIPGGVTVSVSASPDGIAASFSAEWTDGGLERSGRFTAPEALSVDIGTSITITPDPIVNGATGTRYLFEGCSPTCTALRPTTDTSIMLDYSTQHRLTQSMNFGTVSPGSGWYTEGTPVSISATAPSVVTGERYLFQGWTGTGNGSFTGATNSTTITMDTPVTQVASWRHQFKLTLGATSGTVSASPALPADGYYDAGTEVIVEADTPTEPVTGERYIFGGWDGTGTASYSGQSNPVTLRMTSPVTETASWSAHQFLLTLDTNAGTVETDPVSPDGWYDNKTEVTLTARAPATEPGERYLWSGWTVSNEELVSGSDPEIVVTMGEPITARAQWTHQFKLALTTTHGTVSASPASSGGYYNAGTAVQITATPPALAYPTGERYRFLGWDGSGFGAFDGTTNPVTITMDGPITEDARFAHEYLLTKSTNLGTVEVSPAASDGWYAKDVTVRLEATPPPTVTGERYLFNGWTGSGDGSASGTGTVVEVRMRAPITETASWGARQFRLLTSTNKGSVARSPNSNDDYYNAGTVVQLAAHSPATTAGERYVWNGWTGSGTGSYSGTNNPVSVTMNAPMSESASWGAHQFALALRTNHGTVTASPASASGWYDEGTAVQITAVAPTAVPGERYPFRGWIGTGFGSSTTMSNPATVTMNGPVSQEATLGHQFTLTLSKNFGTVAAAPASADGWYEAGTSVQIAGAPPSAGIGERYVFLGWTGSGSGSYTGTNNPATVVMSSPITEAAAFQREFLLTVRAIGLGDGRADVTDAGNVIGRVGTGEDLTKWYAAGTAVSLDVETPVQAGSGRQYEFSSWGTGGTDTVRPKPLPMNSPQTVSATYQTFYVFVDLAGGGTIGVNPTQRRIWFAAPSLNPNDTTGTREDPNMLYASQVAVTRFSEGALSIVGEFNTSTGQFTASVRTARGTYALTNTSYPR